MNDQGNIDLYAQPKVKNPDGSTSTVDSRSYNIDGMEVLLPSVTPDGRHLKADRDIVAEYQKTGRFLGKFKTPAEATAYAAQLHDDYAAGKYDSRPRVSDKAPRIVRFNGETHRFPAEFTDADISSALGAVPAANAKHVSPKAQTWAEFGNDVVTGAVKGLAKTTRSAVSLIPGVEPTARAMGNYLGGKASEMLYGQAAEPVTKEQTREGLKPEGNAQKLGYTAEQIAEFFVPAGAARKATIEGLVRAIPNSASAATMKTLNRAAAITGRVAGEAGSAGTVAALQGEEHPETSAMIAGAGPLAGVAGQVGTKVLKYPITQKMVSLLAGAGAASAVAPLNVGAGLGAYSGVYGMTRALANNILKKPGVIQRLGGLAKTGSEEAARLIAALYAAASDKDED